MFTYNIVIILAHADTKMNVVPFTTTNMGNYKNTKKDPQTTTKRNGELQQQIFRILLNTVDKPRETLPIKTTTTTDNTIVLTISGLNSNKI